MLKQSIVSDEVKKPASRNDDKWQLVAMVQHTQIRNDAELQSASDNADSSDSFSNRLVEQVGHFINNREDTDRSIRLLEAQFFKVI